MLLSFILLFKLFQLWLLEALSGFNKPGIWALPHSIALDVSGSFCIIAAPLLKSMGCLGPPGMPMWWPRWVDWEGGREAQDRGDIGIHMADSLSCSAETNKVAKQLYSNKNNKKIHPCSYMDPLFVPYNYWVVFHIWIYHSSFIYSPVEEHQSDVSFREIRSKTAMWISTYRFYGSIKVSVMSKYLGVRLLGCTVNIYLTS